MTTRRTTPRMMRADELRDIDVTNPLGEDLGSIKEVVLDLQTGRVAYAVLSFGGFLGMGDKLFAIPWEMMKIAPREDEWKLVLDVTKEQLKDAPGFDKDHWPDEQDLDWLNRVYSYYGITPYWR